MKHLVQTRISLGSQEMRKLRKGVQRRKVTEMTQPFPINCKPRNTAKVTVLHMFFNLNALSAARAVRIRKTNLAVAVQRFQAPDAFGIFLQRDSSATLIYFITL